MLKFLIRINCPLLKLTLGFSPCPNDTFIFDALVNHKIDTEGLEFEPVLEDVQTLNEWAKAGKLAISKISYGVLPLVLQDYILLNSGGALGKGVGPLLIAKPGFALEQLEHATIAIPGENTTAHLLFSLAFPNCTNKVFKVFHQIEDAVLNGGVDAGVIIHENRFTYQQKGLIKLIDLGEHWEKQQQVPIPLGGIVVKRNLGTAMHQQIDRVINRSLQYAFEQYPLISNYVCEYAQTMSTAVMKQHIDLYVNDYSLHLGTEGRKAVKVLLDVHAALNGKQTSAVDAVFVD